MYLFFIVRSLEKIKDVFNFLWLILFALPEEIIFRGYFQGLMDKVIGNKTISIIIIRLLFALIHIFNISGFLES